ncbi:alpha-amylase family glycosyl hydrolase [Paenibacillus sp. 481]|uniref:alpha-amylase family glycosyl hydrolase n=1 Tax=Paenibacillus sp. 481 TaxID=2835869 RepID=UPI001E3E0811|nr:alpha-amylase family glycosyl hydrolase [Paenibacillus sp. 481]UHA74963.1 IPT/TIG domain-containing protein [Paenibacillus sp. 481]
MKLLARWTAWLITVSTLLLVWSSPPVQAAPDTAVTNTANFSTDVIYQIVTDRFHDGNPSNNPAGASFDGTCSNLKLYCGGDWQGIIDKINDGYFTGMGVTALWISQPVENIFTAINYSGINNTSYHGYWARDFKKPNPAFGSLSEFQQLIATAHAKHIKVIIDFAPNHTSPAMETDPNFAENGKLYDNGTLVAGYSNDPTAMYHHNGGTDFSTVENGIYRNLFDLADFNHNHPAIDQYFKDAIQMWLNMGVDGIRVDAVKHMPFGWQKNWMSSIYATSPVFTFGEWFLGVNEVSADNHAFANESGMSLLDFRFAQTVRQVFRDNTQSMHSLHSMIAGTAADYRYVNDQVTFIDNHDMDRFHMDNSNKRKLDQALAFTLTSRGVPALYYGTEQYMTGGNDPDNRARIPSFSTNTTAYQIMGKLAPLRKVNPAFGYGTTQERWLNDDVFIFERKFGKSVALVAVNRNLSSGVPINGLLTSLPNGQYVDSLGGLLNGAGLTVANREASPFTLAAGAVAVWHYTTPEVEPRIGHVGPTMVAAGNTLTIDGRAFGTQKGTVYLGGTAITGANILAWEDSHIQVKVPPLNSAGAGAGRYEVKIQTANSALSNVYPAIEVLTGPQVHVRFVIQGAQTTFGENVYLSGSIPELGAWNLNKAIGPMYNQVVYQYPNWYMDVSVPANTTIEYKFVKKQGSSAVWEGGSNRTYTTPSSGTGTVVVNWQQ